MQPSWCLRITSDLDAADAHALALAKRLSATQLNWKPRPDAWSVGQCLEHLCLSNEIYAVPIIESLPRHANGPVDEIAPGWFSRWFIRSFVEPTTQKRGLRAPGKSTPARSQVDPSILDRFLASNAKIREVIARARDHDVNRVRFKNPYVSVIRFTIGTGFHIVARHNHRHLLQAQRVTQTTGFPAV